MKKSHLIPPLYFLSLLKSVASQSEIWAGHPLMPSSSQGKKCATGLPVIAKDNKIGILTDGSCANLNEIVYTTTTDYSPADRIGITIANSFNGSSDYAYIQVDSTKWKIMPLVKGATNNSLPITSAYSAPVAPGLAVCASGTSSGQVCGNLVGLNLNLVVPNPWADGETTMLKGVNKVDTGNVSFTSENIGAPVYVQVNNTAQVLGQVAATNNDDANHKFLYYLPIDSILSASGYSLMTGSAADLPITSTSSTSFPTSIPTFIPPVSGENYVELWLDNYLVNGLPVCGINDQPRLVKRIDPVKKFIRPGKRIVITKSSSTSRSSCSVGYGIIIPAEGRKINGLITAGHCFKSITGGKPVYLEDGSEIGTVGQWAYDSESGRDYAIVYLYSQKDGRESYFLFSPQIPVLTGVGFGAITKQYKPERSGETVCAYGATSEKVVCGTITRFDVEKYDKVKNVQTRGLVEVRTREGSTQKGDSGGPAFLPFGEYSRKIGIVGHITGGNDRFFYYEPLDLQYELATNGNVYAGMEILLNSLPGRRAAFDKCTAGFSVKEANRDRGFLTIAHCSRNKAVGDLVYTTTELGDELIGKLAQISYGGDKGGDYVFVRSLKPEETDYPFFARSLAKINPNKKGVELWNVDSWVDNPAIGTKVCAYGAASESTSRGGYRCGEITNYDVQKEISGMLLKGLVEVKLELSRSGFSDGDSGAPVYLRNKELKTIQAVGLMVGADNGFLQKMWYFPIERILTEFNLELLTTANENPNSQAENLIQAQIEIPPKN